jgi:hypothetical protein
MANCIPIELFGLFEPYKQLFDSNKLIYPMVHIQTFKLNSKDVSLGKMSTIRFKVGDVTFIKFFSSPSDKNKLHVEDNKNIDMEVEVIGSAVYNEYMGNRYKQIMIDKFEVREVKPLNFDELWGE